MQKASSTVSFVTENKSIVQGQIKGSILNWVGETSTLWLFGLFGERYALRASVQISYDDKNFVLTSIVVAIPNLR